MVATLQVTLGSGPTQVSAASIEAKHLVIQNNAGHVCRVGDANVTMSGGGRGIMLAAGGSGSPGGALDVPLTASNTNLQNWWIAGTANDVIDVLYE